MSAFWCTGCCSYKDPDAYEDFKGVLLCPTCYGEAEADAEWEAEQQLKAEISHNGDNQHDLQ